MEVFCHYFYYKILYICASALFFARSDAQLYMEEDNEDTSPVFDFKKIIKSESELCKDQIKYLIMNNTFLFLRFLDASMRLPRGIMGMNYADYGNFYQCLDINEPYKGSSIAGKYCILSVPPWQMLNLPGFSKDEKIPDINAIKLGRVQKIIITKFFVIVKELQMFFLHFPNDITDEYLSRPFRLATCIPRMCSVKEVFDTFVYNVSSTGLHYDVAYCRLPNDKPWVTADTVALIIFIVIGFLNLISSTYELFFIFILKRAEDKANVYFRLFSLYNNTQQLCKFSASGDYLSCLDGIKVLSLMVVINAHVFHIQSFDMYMLDLFEFKLWWGTFTMASMTFHVVVDTFYTTTGILLVYNTARKMDGMILLKNLPLFYLDRLMHILPLLVTIVIMEASIFHRIADGPEWVNVADNVLICRKYWLYTLLQLQHYIEPEEMCIKQSWYIAIDLQMHLLSPLLLFWLVNGRSGAARKALVTALTSTMVISTIYCVTLDLPCDLNEHLRLHQRRKFLKLYYMHIISRITPFLVGMTIGYVLHLWRGKKIKINNILVVCLWLMAFGSMAFLIFLLGCISGTTWDDHIVDALVNILMRPTWATAIGWIVIACAHGYGGPINWILSHPVWRLPNRMIYGMFLFHYPMIKVVQSATLSPPLFSLSYNLFEVMAYVTISFMASFAFTVLIHMPLYNLYKHLVERGAMNRGRWKRLEQVEEYELELARE